MMKRVGWIAAAGGVVGVSVILVMWLTQKPEPISNLDTRALRLMAGGCGEGGAKAGSPSLPACLERAKRECAGVAREAMRACAKAIAEHLE